MSAPIAMAALTAVAGTAAIEWWNGRAIVCRCGAVRLWTGTVDGPEGSQQLADWYSLSHVVHGLLFYAVLRLALPRVATRWRFPVAVFGEAGWEVLENSPWIIDRYRSATIAFGYTGDSILNSLGDIGFMALGFLLAARSPTWLTIAIGLGCEMLALAIIRDNLTLNVIMLLHPIAEIRTWQAM